MSDPIDELKRRVDAAGKVARAGAIAKSGSSNATPASVLAPRASGKLDPPSSSAENTSFRQWLRDHSLSVRLAYEVKDWILPPVKLERDFDLDIHRAKGMWPMDGDDGLRRRAKTGLARAGQSMDRLSTFCRPEACRSCSRFAPGRTKSYPARKIPSRSGFGMIGLSAMGSNLLTCSRHFYPALRRKISSDVTLSPVMFIGMRPGMPTWPKRSFAYWQKLSPRCALYRNRASDAARLKSLSRAPGLS